MDISTEDIAHILEAIDKLDCSMVEVSVGDVRIMVRRGSAGDAPPVMEASTPAAAITVPQAAAAPKTAATPKPASVSAPARADDLAIWLEREAQGTALVLRAPMIGTFYCSKAPGEPPFVEVGSPVQVGDTLGLMEVMKLFHSLVAEVNGSVGAVFAQNAQLVEFDQPVFAIAKS